MSQESSASTIRVYEMSEERDIPKWSGLSVDAGAGPITFAILEKQYNYLRSDEYAQELHRRREQFEAEDRARWARIERRWMEMHDTTEMTEGLRNKLLDAWWDTMCKYTNILEVLS